MTTSLPRWRVFLRPGWIALAIAVVLFAVLCFWVFAPWQLGKHSRTQQRDDRIERALAAPPAALAEVMRAGFGAQSEWRAVSVTGRYESDKQVLLRHRPVHGNAQGPQVLAPLRLADGTSILVNRGYLPQDATAPPPAPAGEVTLHAKLRLAETTPAGRETRTLPSGATEVPAIDPLAVQNIAGPLEQRAYLQLDQAQPGSLGTLEEPDLDPGPYLSYGLQWLAFGVIALAALGYFGYTELRPDPLSQDSALGKEQATRAGTATEPTDRPNRAERKRRLRAALAGDVPQTHQTATIPPVADRYGR